jgi:hypothetical protein
MPIMFLLIDYLFFFVSLQVVSKDLATQTDSIEKWYKTPYKTQKLPQNLLQVSVRFHKQIIFSISHFSQANLFFSFLFSLFFRFVLLVFRNGKRLKSLNPHWLYLQRMNLFQTTFHCYPLHSTNHR